MSGEPIINKQIVGGFRWMLPRLVKKRFHAFATNRRSLKQATISPQDCLIVYANHASWWDPITAMMLADRVFGGFRMYAPIDAEALEKYKIFKKMGFFGVEQGTQRGAAAFLKTSRLVLSRAGAAMWLTPEGRFADPRDRDASLMPGLAHLASKLEAGSGQWANGPAVWVVPLAIEYAFWEESNPELLTWFGDPVKLRCTDLTNDHPAAGWQEKQTADEQLTASLRAAQDRLAIASIARDSDQFEILLGGKSGSVGIYDFWRQTTAIFGRRPAGVEHSDKLRN